MGEMNELQTDLAAAFETHDVKDEDFDPDPVANSPDPEPDNDSQSEDVADSPVIEKLDNDEKEPEKEPETDEIAAKTDVEPEKAEPTPAKGEKAPAGWSPAAREKWGGLPDDIKSQVMKREKEAQQAMDNSAVARKSVESLNRVFEPYREGLIASGAPDPFTVVGQLLQTEATMRVGSQQQKAAQVARLISDYGVDLQTLDSILLGQVPENNPNSQLESMIDQRMAPVNELMQQMNYQQQQQEESYRQGAATSVGAFSESAEFLADVRLDMADLIDMATARNQTLTLEEAYNKACAIHPEISKVIEQRQNEARIMGTAEQTVAKKNAAVSITGNQSGGGGASGNRSMEQTVRDAWDSQMG